jgi:bacterioferritin-associated ferredoxin
VIVCHCSGITDRDIRSLVQSGRATSLRDLGRSCAAGLGCGGCRLEVDRIVRQEEIRRKDAGFSQLSPAV